MCLLTLIRSGFYQEVRLLAALDDPHLSRVLAVCTTEEPFCVVLEYLEFGDLNQFLKLHRFRPDNHHNSSDSRNNISKTFSTPDETLTYELIRVDFHNVFLNIFYVSMPTEWEV